jgi:hypothetical protein
MTSSKTLNEETFFQMRDDLWENYPDARAAMMEAASNLPDPLPTGASLAHHAGLFVEKPLYANMKAEKGGLGDRYSYMWRNGGFPTPERLASPGWDIEQVGQHEYVAKGAEAIAFQNAPAEPLGATFGFPGTMRPRVALARLYRMRKIASRFPAALPMIQAAQAGFRTAKDADDFLGHMKPVLEAFDTGAMTTKFHAMTDLGFECIKPDLHAARTLAWFRQIQVRRPVPGQDVNAQAFSAPLRYLGNHWNKCHVVSRGVALARTLSPERLNPIFKGNACREVDIVLMQASLHDVILKHA